MKKILFVVAALAFGLFLLPSSAHAQSCPGGALHCATLNWVAPATGPSPTGYNIYRNTTAAACPAGVVVASTCTKVGSTTAPTVTYTDSPLAASTTYFYVVTAVDASGESITSNQITVTTAADPVPNPPTGLTGSAQ